MLKFIMLVLTIFCLTLSAAHVNSERFSNNHVGGFVYESYNKAMRCTAKSPKAPKTLSDIQAIVKNAVLFKQTVKAFGSLHSETDVICTDGVPINITYINHLWLDPQTNYVTSGAGVELHQLLDFLAEKGRALLSSPTYGGITIGGATGTGVHGSSLQYPAAISDLLVSITYVDGHGNIKKISEEDEDFKAFRVHLGLLGIIYELVIRTVPQYKLKINNSVTSDSILFNDNGQTIMKFVNDHPNMLQLFWFPNSQQVVLSVAETLPVNSSGNCETHISPEVPAEEVRQVALAYELIQTIGDDLNFFFVENYSKLAYFKYYPGFKQSIYTEANGVTPCLPTAVGYSHKMITSSACSQCVWDNLGIDEYGLNIPLSEFVNALGTLKQIFNEGLVHFPLSGIYIRFMQRSDAYLGQSNIGDMVNFEWVSIPRFDRSQPKLGLATYQAMGQALIEKHNGNSHWAKYGLYYLNPQIIRRAFPDLDKFINVMNKVDPNEIFMNDFGRRLKYGATKVTAPAEMLTRCALNDICLCKDDLDCGNGGPLDYECGSFVGYRVCKRKPNPFLDIKDIASKQAIRVAAELLTAFD